jgi:glycosyltransferase involved in cell wall biosynthesis
VKILFASQSFFPSTGGVSYYLIWLGRGLKSLGHESVFINLKGPVGPESQMVEGFKVYKVPKEGGIDKEVMQGYATFKEMVLQVFHRGDIPLDRLYNRHLYGFNEYIKVNEIFEKRLREVVGIEKPDLIHVHDFQLLPQGEAIRDLGLPVPFTWHIPFTEDAHENWRRFALKYLQGYSNCILSTKPYVNVVLKSGLPWNKVTCIPPFIDVEAQAISFREKYGIRQDEKLILCVARLDRLKGQDVLIKSAPKIRGKFRIVFIGNGSFSKEVLKVKAKEEYHRELHEAAAENGLGKKVLFTGSIDRKMLMAAYQECDLVVLPSLQEGFGLAIAEGMAFGKPVVGTAVGGMPTQIWPGVNGFLVPPNDPESLADAIGYVINNRPAALEMGRNSRRIYKESFSTERGVRDHLALYNRLLDQEQAGNTG